MDVLDAVRMRKSIRGFRPDPVPKETLQQILEVAVRAPSANNTQPWEFVVLGGKVLDDLRKANVEAFYSGMPADPGIPSPPEKWGEPYRRRQVKLGVSLFRLLGVGKDDSEGKMAWAEKGLRFFDAPAVILLCVDKSDKDIVYIFDCGCIAQTIALAALRFGLGTCIQRHVSNYPEVIRKVTGIPASKRVLVGLAIGYVDTGCRTYNFQSEREPLEDTTTWFGFD